MAPNAFIGKAAPPTETELAEALGPAKPLWDELLRGLSSGFALDTHEWHSYSPKAGWALRVVRGKRRIVYLAPLANTFEVLFILGSKAMDAARAAGLSLRLLKVLDDAPKYPEGWGVRFDVKSQKDLGDVNKLAAAKLAN